MNTEIRYILFPSAGFWAVKQRFRVRLADYPTEDLRSIPEAFLSRIRSSEKLDESGCFEFSFEGEPNFDDALFEALTQEGKDTSEVPL